MIRNTILGVAAAAAVIAIGLAGNATTAAARGYKGGYYGYYKPYHCQRYFAGYRKVWTYYEWKLRPYYKQHCFYGY